MMQQLTVVLCIYLLTGCIQRLDSPLCRNLVITDGQAMCNLPEGVLPIAIVGAEVFGGTRGAQLTLRDALSRLGSPSGNRVDENGDNWWLFGENSSRLEATCRQNNSVGDRCFWYLRSHRVRTLAEHPRFQFLFKDIREQNFNPPAIHLVSAQRPDGSRDSIAVEIDNGQITAVTWYDPIGTADLILSWNMR